MAKFRSTRPARRAATLIDLVITVLILGILSAVAAPRFVSTLNSMQVEAAARRVASDLNYCKKTAVQTSKTTSITFRTSPVGYDMLGVEHPAYPGQNYICNLSDISSTLSLTTINFNGTSTLNFNAYGRPMVGGTALLNGILTLKAGGQSQSVIVNPTTGEAVVQ